MKMVRLAILALAVLTAAVFVPGRANASDHSDVMAVINSAVTAFNKGDAKAWTALCTSPAAIISNVPPFQYQGATTCADWWGSNAAANKKSGVTDEMVTLGTAWHVIVSGDRAYAAVPAAFSYKQKGNPVKSSGNVLTVALQKTASGWLMTGWSWAQR
ncbi:MAG: hypothetical protein WA814_00590 [Candidatus Baltobacteraceae bacterium]